MVNKEEKKKKKRRRRKKRSWGLFFLNMSFGYEKANSG
jgi:hypothetical protein